MEVKKGKLEGLLVMKSSVFEDERGCFYESFNQKEFNEKTGLSIQFLQDNESISEKNVLRGLHFQAPPFAQSKLVRVIKGSVLDVAVDIRKNSSTYGEYQSILLSEKNKLQFYIPEGFAHGFLTLDDNTIFAYKCTNYYNKKSEGGIFWNDPTLNIKWKTVNNLIISQKDKVLTSFTNLSSPF